MKMQLIRNATLRLLYAGHNFVIDPYLSPKHALPSYTGRSRNPLVDLPCPPAEVIAGVDFALISHLHSDHFDTVAQQMLPAETPLFCQPDNEARIRALGFSDIRPVAGEATWHNVSIRRTGGRHGSSESVLKAMGSVSGFVLRAEGEPTIYWTGDTVWTDEVAAVIEQERPDLIIVHAGGAVWKDAAGQDELIIMDAAQTVQICHHAPAATVIATHMEALDHCLTSRADLRTAARAAGIPDARLRIPADGEIIDLTVQTIDSYIAAYPASVQAILQEIRQVIQAAAPDAVEAISYGIPTFKLRGKNLVHFGAFKHHIGFYPTPAGFEPFTTQLSVYKQGKGSVQFPLDQPMPYALIREIVQFRVSEILARTAKKK